MSAAEMKKLVEAGKKINEMRGRLKAKGQDAISKAGDFGSTKIGDFSEGFEKFAKSLDTGKLFELFTLLKAGELLGKEEEEKKSDIKKIVTIVVSVIAVLALLAGIAYAVYRFLTPAYLEEDDEDYDEDLDLYDDDDEYELVEDPEDDFVDEDEE